MKCEQSMPFPHALTSLHIVDEMKKLLLCTLFVTKSASKEDSENLY